jgi:hypothetical protein
VSFVILTAYAPPAESPASGNAGPASFPLLFSVAQVPASGSAGPASFPLLFNLATAVIPDPDPDPGPDLDSIDWRDHSPDLLLFWEDEDADGVIIEAVSPRDTLAFVDHGSATTLLLARPVPTALEWVDHPSLTYPSDSRFPSENTYPSNN